MIRESRLIHRRATEFRQFSTSNPAEQVRMLQTRDRTLQRKESERRAAEQQRQRTESQAVADLNNRYGGSGTNFVRTPSGVSEVTPFGADGTRNIVSQSRLDKGSLTAYQKRLEQKYAPLLAEKEQRKRELAGQMAAAIETDKSGGGDGAGVYAQYQSQIDAIDQEIADTRARINTAEQPTSGRRGVSDFTNAGAATQGKRSITERMGMTGRDGSATSTTTNAGKSGSTATGQMTLADLTAEENAAIAPILASLRKQKGNAQSYARAGAELLDQRQDQIDQFGANAKYANQAVLDERLDIAKQQMDYESELSQESLYRQKRDEELIQQEIDREYERLESRQLEENVREEQRMRTATGARYGGFGSGAGLRKINDSIREGNRLARELGEDKVHAKKEFRNRLADLEANHRLTLRDIMIRHDASVSTAMQDALNKAIEIDEKTLDEEGDKLDKAGELMKEVLTMLNTIEEKTGTELTKANQNALQRRETLRAERKADEEKQKQDALDQYKYVISTWGNTNPTAIQNALRRMREVGYDTTGLENGEPTLDQLQKLKDSSKVERSDPFRFTDPAERQAAATALKVVANLPNQALQQQHLDYIYGLLDAGDVEGANEYMKGLAASSLKGTEATEYASRDLMISAGEELIQTLDQLAKDGTNRGFYTKKWQDAQKYKLFGDQSRDPRYLEVSARIANMAATLIKEKYGANVTEQEFARANDFIPQASDTVLDAKVKIEQLIKYLKNNNDTVLNRELGIRRSAKPPPIQPEHDYNDSSFYEDTLDVGGGFGRELLKFGRETQNYNTPLDPNLYPASTIKAWDGTHKGIDIALPEDTALTSFVDGEVVSAKYDGGYGNSIVIRAGDGSLHRLSHLKSFASDIAPGTRIKRGQLLALSGGRKGDKGAGLSTGPHLDYRIQVNGKYIDPMSYRPGSIASQNTRI